jgi:hypothetical protein
MTDERNAVSVTVGWADANAQNLVRSLISPWLLGLPARSLKTRAMSFAMSKRLRVEWIITVERATQKNSQLAAARRVALKMGRLLRCWSVTYRFRDAPLAPGRLGPPRRRPFLNATKLKGFRRRYTKPMPQFFN